MAVAALLFAAYAGWQAKEIDTGPGSVQLGKGLFTIVVAAGILAALYAAAMAASRGMRGLARAIVLSVVALVVGYFIAYTIAPSAAAERIGSETAVLLVQVRSR